IKHMLVGSLLTVQASKVWTTAAIYAVIGVFHWIFRAKFFAISEDADAAEKAGIRVRFWDFLFYVSFGFVITSSVSIAGVLLVFSYLVVPGVIAVMFADSTRARVAIAWSVGTLVSVLGMFISNAGDFPTGPSIVAGFTATLLVSGVAHYLTASEHSGVAFKRLLAGGAVVALLIWGTTFLRKHDDHEHGPEDTFSKLVEGLKSDNDTQVLQALDHLRDMKEKDTHFVEPVLALVKKTKSDQVLEHAADVLSKLDDPAALPVLKEAAARDLDADLQVHIARTILDLRDPAGFGILVKVLDSDPPPLAREEALHLASERSGSKLDAASFKKWWTERGAMLKWKTENKRFE